MTRNRFSPITRCLLASVVVVLGMTGCRSVTTLILYNGPDVPAAQLTTLVVPWCITLRTIDGLPAPSTLANEMRLILGPGPHTMEARYVVLYPTQGSDTEKIASDYVRVKFNGKAGATYTICSKDPKTLEAARRYAANVELWVEEDARGVVNKVSAGNSGSLKESPTVMHTEGAAPAPAVGNPDVQAQLQAIWDKASESDRKAFVNKVTPAP
jgi:Uncharacterized protein conserved in bacteria (DUF2057)